jgi:hypothetical protein
MSIAVYSAEREAGLEDLIKANASIALLANAGIAEPFSINESSKANLLAKASNKNQIDLHYIRSIMVTAGWNRNDDVFDNVEMWAAKATPEDKPFNLEHNQADIIGHITGSVAVNVDLSPIPEDISLEKLPKQYHIVTTAVLYKIWENAELQSRMDKMILEIAQGKWFVSMEALFHGFDYSLKNANGTQIVARNDKTAFLTKHLRAYGGNGTYEGAQVGRILRQITFSGKGLVRKPANPGSVILDAYKVSGYEVPREECFNMSEDSKNIESEVVQAKEKAAKLEIELAAASEELLNLKAERRQARLVASTTEALGSDSDAIANALIHLDDNQFAVALAAINDYLNAKIAAYKAAESRSRTVEQVDNDLKTVAEELKSILQQVKDYVSKSPKEEKEAKEEESEAGVKSIKKMPLPKKPLPPEAAQIVSGSVLNNVIPNEEPALAASSVDQSVNKVAAQIAAFFGASENEELAAD